MMRMMVRQPFAGGYNGRREHQELGDDGPQGHDIGLNDFNGIARRKLRVPSKIIRISIPRPCIRHGKRLSSCHEINSVG